MGEKVEIMSDAALKLRYDKLTVSRTDVRASLKSSDYYQPVSGS